MRYGNDTATIICMLHALLALAHLPLPKLRAVKLTFHPEFSVSNVFFFMMLQLKDAYPNFQIKLPGKRWFKDNFDAGITI